MRVIAEGTLKGIRAKQGRAPVPEDRSSAVERVVFGSIDRRLGEFGGGKSEYTSASIVSSERVVFNIKGNDYRLVTAIDYEGKMVLIIWLGTHREYDRIDVKKVEYDRKRCANSSGPD